MVSMLALRQHRTAERCQNPIELQILLAAFQFVVLVGECQFSSFAVLA